VYVFEKAQAVKIKKAALTIMAFFLPWLILVIMSKPPLSQEFWIPKLTLGSMLNIPGLLFTGYEDLIGFTYVLIPHISLFFALFFAYAGYLVYPQFKGTFGRKKAGSDRLLLFLFFWTVIPTIVILALSAFKPVFLPRYNIFITIGFLLLFIRLLKYVSRRLEIIVLIVVFTFSLHYGMVQVFMRNKADLRKPLKEIKNLMGRDDVVFVTDPYNFHPAEYYIDDKSVFIYGKSYESLPWYIGKVLIPEDRTASSLPLYPRKAFILKDETSYSIQAVY
jgi:hypothetical protein